MSAKRDRSQRFTFVYSNLYQIYKDGQKDAKNPASPEAIRKQSFQRVQAQSIPHAASPSVAPQGLTRKHVLKAADQAQARIVTEEKPSVKVQSYAPPALIGKRIEQKKIEKNHLTQKTAAIQQAVQKIADTTPSPAGKRLEDLTPARSPAVESLKKNLDQLSELHSRLKFMLQELETVVKKS